MSPRLTRVAASGAVAAVLAAGSLFAAPAANAATHHVSAGYSSNSETVKVGSHKDKLSIKKASSSVVLVHKATKEDAAVYAPAAYTVTLTNAKGHKLFTKKLSTWRGLNVFLETETHTYKTDAALLKQVKHDAALSSDAAKKSYKVIEAKVNAEFGLGFTVAFSALNVYGWVQANPTATSFDGFYATAPNAAAADEFRQMLSGTPQDYTLTSKDKATGIALSLRVVGNDFQAAKGTWTGPVVYGTFKIGNTTTTLNRK